MKIGINKKEILIFFLLLWHFEPTFLGRIPLVHTFFSAGKIISCLLFTLFLIGGKKKYSPSLIVVAALVIESICLGVTIFYDRAIGEQLVILISNVVLVMVDYCLHNWKKQLKRVLIFIFEILIYMNFLCMCFFPEGLYNYEKARNYWLFGHVNDMVIYTLPAIVLAALSITKPYFKKKNIRYLLLMLVSIVTIVYAWSATSVLGLLIWFGVLLLNKKKNYFTAIQGVLVGVLIFITINIVQIQNGVLVYLVELFGRDITFSGRIGVWNRAMNAIKEHMLLGYGEEAAEITLARFHFAQAHCRYFNIIYRGGIVSFFIQLGGYLGTALRLDKFKRNKKKQVIIAAVWVLMIQSAFESYTTPLFYLVFIFGENVDKIFEDETERKYLNE